MQLTRKERIAAQRKKLRQEQLKKINHHAKKSVAVLGSSVMIGTAVMPATQVFASEVTTSTKSTAQQFLELIIPHAKRATQDKDVYTSVMIAQAILETGWGNSTLSQAPYYNVFGIKGNYNGESVELQTLEDAGNQQYYTIVDSFKKYPSYTESFDDYVYTLTGTPWRLNFYSGALKSNTTSYQDATSWLTGRYATDTAYGGKLNRLIEQYNLTQYDTVSTNTNTNSTTREATSSQVSEKTYTVVSGDSLYGIARKTGVSIQTLLSLNNLSLSSIIHPGNVLKLSSATTVTPVTPVAPLPSTGTPTSGSSSQVSEKTYTVVSGDSLYGIARKTGVTVQTLLSLNNLSLSSIIHPGDVLKLSSQAVPASVSVKAPVSAGTSAVKTYVVKAGDSLYRIALSHGLSLDELKTLNQLTSALIHPGDVLKVSK